MADEAADEIFLLKMTGRDSRRRGRDLKEGRRIDIEPLLDVNPSP
jgi:hypothetical protein